jgi:hypothetical protein
MKYVNKYLVIMALIILFPACKSDPNEILRDRELNDFRRAPLFGMVYDDRNQPCQNARITLISYSPLGEEDHSGDINGRMGSPVTSDINGRFILSDLYKGQYTVEITRAGYETQTMTFAFTNQSQVLYISLVSFEGLMLSAEEALADSEFAVCAGLLARAEALKPGHPGLMYLKAVYHFKKGEREEAAGLLRALIERGEDTRAVRDFLAVCEESGE